VAYLIIISCAALAPCSPLPYRIPLRYTLYYPLTILITLCLLYFFTVDGGAYFQRRLPRTAIFYAKP